LTPFRRSLPIPGYVELVEAGWLVEADGPYARGAVSTPGDMRRRDTRQVSAVEVAADKLGTVLVVRSRRPGDRLRPRGLGGSQKLQDLLVNRKVGRRERDRVPIVTDESGRIVWVAGQVSTEEFRVTGDTKAVIILKLRRI
jgi:tRNA(Ile)-lysidine synthetase-like protein